MFDPMFDEDELIESLDKLNNDGMRARQRFNLDMSEDPIGAMSSLAEVILSGVKVSCANYILKDDGRTIYQKAVSMKAKLVRDLLHNVPACRSSNPFVVAGEIYQRQALSEFVTNTLAGVPGEDDLEYQRLLAQWRADKLKQPIRGGDAS